MEIVTPPVLGPISGEAIAQIFGMRELLKDGWDISHTVARKKGSQ